MDAEPTDPEPALKVAAARLAVIIPENILPVASSLIPMRSVPAAVLNVTAFMMVMPDAGSRSTPA